MHLHKCRSRERVQFRSCLADPTCRSYTLWLEDWEEGLLAGEPLVHGEVGAVDPFPHTPAVMPYS